MTTDRFEEILQQLGTLVDFPLHPDKRGACKLNINNTLHVQIEFQLEKERLLLMSFICDVPPGKFRENILKDALKANWPYPLMGNLCYSERNNKLALFSFFPLVEYTPEKLLDHLKGFIAKAESWRTGVETGQTSTLTSKSKSSGPNIFGLK